MRHGLSGWGSQGWFLVVAMALLTGCGEPMFENAGSQNSLLEDREACAMEMEQSPAALAYRQNPTAHPEYVSQVFIDMNRCIERKGWKQVRSQQEQEQMREAIDLNWLKQVSRRHAQIPRPQTRSCAGSRRDSRAD